jgi:NRPS condensation-like uncharacterized protein
MSGEALETLARRGARPLSIDRRLGPTENIYCLLDKLYCLNFVVFAEVDGALDSDRLAHAVQAAQAEHPLLRARVTAIRGRNWFKPVPPELQPLTIEVAPLRNWRARIAAELDTAFDGEAPLARFLWCRGRGRRSVAAMVFHHAIADGRSGAELLIEVLRRAGGEDIAPSYRHARPSAHDLDLVERTGKIRGSIKKLAYWLNQGRSALRFPQQLPGYDTAVRPARAIRAIPFAVPAAAARALQRACRAHRTTVHGALGAAQLLAINREFESAGPRTLALNSLADLRGVLEGGLTAHDLGLYVATLITVHGVDARGDFWQLAADVRNQLEAILDSGDANLVHSIYREDALFPPNLIGARMVQAMVGMAPSSSMLTNIGRIDRIALGNGARVASLAFLVSPPAQHPICVTATGYGGAMDLNLLYDRHKIGDAQARRIADSMRSLLVEAARDRR